MRHAEPSHTGLESIRLIGSAIMPALRYVSALIGLWNMAFGLFAPFLCAFTANPAKCSCFTSYCIM